MPLPSDSRLHLRLSYPPATLPFTSKASDFPPPPTSPSTAPAGRQYHPTPALIATNAFSRVSDSVPSPTSSASSLFSSALSLSSVSTAQHFASDPTNAIARRRPGGRGDDDDEVGTVEAAGGAGDSASAPGVIAIPFGGGVASGSGDATGDRGYLAGTKRHTDDRAQSDLALPLVAGPGFSARNSASPRSASWKRPRLIPSVKASLIWESDSDANFDAVPGLADMLGPTKNEHEPVKTQRLHRGEVTSGVSATPAATAATTLDTAAGPAVQSSSPPTTPLLSPDDYSLLAELLDQDDRLIFVIDANSSARPQLDPLPILFANSALRALPRIFDVLSGSATHREFSEFRAWALNRQRGEEKGDTLMPVAFAGVQWTASTLRHRYRVLRGSHVASTPTGASPVAAETQVLPCQLEAEALPTLEATQGTTPVERDSPSDTSTADATEATAVEDEDITPTSTKPPAEGGNTAASFDWTRIAITDDVPAHIKFARSIDWGATPLGPIELWAGDLRGMTNLVMGSPYPAALYCGPDFTVIYNEAFTAVLGRNHPSLMGSSVEDSWPEVWNSVESAFRNAWTAGQAVFKRDHRMFIDRDGFLEESYFNYSLVPLVGLDGSVIAIYNQLLDNTRRKINERRMLTLHEVGEKTAVAKTAHALWRAVCSGFESNEYDMPFFMLYSAESNNDKAAEKSDTVTPPRVVLEASLGVSQGHPAAARALDLHTSDEGFAPYMRQALSVAAARKQDGSLAGSGAGEGGAVRMSPPVVLSVDDGTLPAQLMDGLRGERGFDHPCHTVVVFPIQHPTASGEAARMTVSGFVVLGINPHRPYDHDYRMFVHLLARHLTTSLASVALFEEEVQRSQRMALQAAQDRQELARQLQLRTQQVMESESKFRLMAEFTPVGIFVADGAGHITYNNDMWTKISRYPDAPPSGSLRSPTDSNAPTAEADQTSSWLTWMELVMEEDRPGLAAAWDRIVHGKDVVTHEFRFKQRTTIQSEDGSGPPIDTTTWVLLRAYPDKDENGNLKRMFGCITDISKQKLAEDFQSRLWQEAVEHRRQQENFIDVTSHELRNPLSAILQSVDEINNTVAEFREKACRGNTSLDAALSAPDVSALLDSVLEASSTISLCANHQKRMVEDVIILSKVDSHLLLVTPVEVQPVMVVRQTLKIFDSELLAHDIRCTFQVEPSYQNLVGLSSWVKLDPSRLNQVLINLISNAIKFTQKCEERSIVVHLGASEEQEDERQQHAPVDSNVFSSLSDIAYVPRRQDTSGVADGSDWGDGHKMNLHIAVSDTGLGLNDEDKDVLLQHFSQASPRTHVQYGGGLGLFISRSLTELQGGQIGIRSHNGRGGTFAFYVKCRRVPSTPVGVTPGTSNLSAAIPELSFARRGAGSLVVFESGGSGGRRGDSSTGGRNDNGSGSSNDGSNDNSKSPAKPTVHAKLPPTPVMLLSPTSEDPSMDFITVPTNAKSVAMEAVGAGSTTAAASRVSSNNNINRNGSGNGNASGIGSGDSSTAAEADEPSLAVLIVEDNLVNQRVLQRQLDRSGSRTFVANHGGEALDVLRQSTFWRPTDDEEDAAAAAAVAAVTKDDGTMGAEARLPTTAAAAAATATEKESRRSPRIKISVVLMDLEMPVMDGMTCARAIRALERSGTLVRHVPIIAVTAYVRQEQIESAKAAGVDDVISKPFRLAQLMPKIQELVAQYDGAGGAAATAAAGP